MPEPLVVAGDTILAGYADDNGVGRHYMINLETGELRWVSRPGPMSWVAVDGDRSFLIGRQGYGAFESELRSPDGTRYQTWESHGLPIIDGVGNITLVEMSNYLSVPQHVARLDPDGSVTRGTRLPGYPSTHPVLSADGRIVFFRAGLLFVVDHDLEVTVITEEADLEETAIWTRTLLLDDGTVVFGVGDQLWLVETDLAPMAEAPWPCGSGTAGANPVVTR